MEATELIVTALVAGGAASHDQAAGSPMAAAQAELKALLTARLADRPAGLSALTEVGTEAGQGPEHVDESWRSALAVELERVGAGEDQALLGYAHQMMVLLDQAGARGGAYRVESAQLDPGDAPS